MIILKYLKNYKSWIDAVCEENLYFKVDRFYKICDIKIFDFRPYSNFALRGIRGKSFGPSPNFKMHASRDLSIFVTAVTLENW